MVHDVADGVLELLNAACDTPSADTPKTAGGRLHTISPLHPLYGPNS